jgi:hypothetical protein
VSVSAPPPGAPAGEVRWAYRLAVRARVCPSCIDGGGWGDCLLDSSVECPVQSFLPQVVDLVTRSGPGSVQEYVTELRSIVCSRCAHRFEDGACSLRQELECPLDRHFPQVIEAVERVNRRLRMQAEEARGDDTECG